MAAVTIDALHLTRTLFADVHTPRGRVAASHPRARKGDRHGPARADVFLARVLTGTLSAAQSDECRALIRAADEIESVADYCERLANYRRRLIREGAGLDDSALRDLQSYLERTTALFEDIIDRIRRNESGWLDAVVTRASTCPPRRTRCAKPTCSG